MNETVPAELQPSPLEAMFTAEEEQELGELMLSFDGGMLDYGELDGFLSALAVAPQPSTLDRWWTALFGPEPEWEAEHEPERARALVARYYAMVQARVAVDPHELGPACVPPLEGWQDGDGDDEDPGADEFGDEDLYGEDDDVEDLASPAHHGEVVPQVYGAPGAVEGGNDDEDDDAAELADDDDSIFGDDDDSHIEPDAEGSVEFGYAETWLSGFRYALSLQSDDWRRVLDEEPALAPWLHLLWQAADDFEGESPLDALPAMAPTAAPPEDAGFLALEATLRERAQAHPEIGAVEDEALTLLIPEMLHQLWRRHRAQAGPVAGEIAHRYAEGLLDLRDADEDDLHELLLRHALPDMHLEYLDGWWSALAAAGEEFSPLEQLDRILGKDKVFEDAEEARDLLHGLLRHWQMVRERQARDSGPEDPMCAPFIDFPPGEDPEKYPQRPYGREFALGFLAGVEELPRSARLLLMDPEAKHWLAPFEALAKGHSLEKKGKRLGFEERMGLIAELPQCIRELGAFWTGGSGTRPQRAPARAEPLPGRNDPCPCGSGKKYKKCHGAPERLN